MNLHGIRRTNSLDGKQFSRESDTNLDCCILVTPIIQIFNCLMTNILCRYDCPLSENGNIEAAAAGALLKKEGLNMLPHDAVPSFCSTLGTVL